jgi:hypothetical protein
MHWRKLQTGKLIFRRKAHRQFYPQALGGNGVEILPRFITGEARCELCKT